jgi:hypothetical protein
MIYLFRPSLCALQHTKFFSVIWATSGLVCAGGMSFNERTAHAMGAKFKASMPMVRKLSHYQSMSLNFMPEFFSEVPNLP